MAVCFIFQHTSLYAFSVPWPTEAKEVGRCGVWWEKKKKGGFFENWEQREMAISFYDFVEGIGKWRENWTSDLWVMCSSDIFLVTCSRWCTWHGEHLALLGDCGIAQIGSLHGGSVSQQLAMALFAARARGWWEEGGFRGKFSVLTCWKGGV